MGKKNTSKKEYTTPKLDSITENPLFVEYYQNQGIVPEGEWDSFCAALGRPLPTSFRISGTAPLQNTISEYVKRFEKVEFQELDDNGEAFQAPRQLPWYPGGVTWQTTVPRKAIKKIPELGQFRQFLISQSEHGNITRQEVVSMLPPLFMDVAPNHKILDMCAAPGSKTSQLIEMLHANGPTPDGFIIANDLRPERSYLLVNHVQRLRTPSVIISCHEAQNFPLLFKGGDPIFFDRILCDAPCSGDGTIRKNRDMCGKWSPTFGINQHRQQIKIAHRGLELLKVGGRMVYSTCSFNPLEDEAVVMELLRRSNGAVSLVDVSGHFADLVRCPGKSTWKVMDKDKTWYNSYDEVPEDEKKGGRLKRSHFPPDTNEAFADQLTRCVRILPHHQNTGGFFLAVFSKSKPIPPSSSFLQAKADRGAENSTGADDLEGEDQGEMEAALMEEHAFGKRTGKQDRHFLEKGFKPFPDSLSPILERCGSLYGFRDSFPQNQLLVRSDEATKIYFVSKAVMEVATANSEDKLRIVNMGLKLLSAHEGDAAGVGYRVCHEAVSLILPHISKRVIHISRNDLSILLKNKDPFVEMLDPASRAILMTLDIGPCVLVVDDDASEFNGLVFSAWRGKTSVHLLISNQETQCYDFLLCTIPT